MSSLPRRALAMATKLSATQFTITQATSRPNANKDHHRSDGRFQNPWPSFTEYIRSWSGVTSMAPLIFRMQLTGAKDNPPAPQRKPVFTEDQSSELKATWLGHASWLLQLPATGAERGLRILCDPVFSDRVSPVSFMGPKRLEPLKFTIDDLPDVDLVILSHNHYDHMDVQSLRKIFQKQASESIRFFVPLKNGTVLVDECKIPKEQITECDWWDAYSVSAVLGQGQTQQIKLTCTPCQHQTNRGSRDNNIALWSSWVIESSDYRVYFGGDSAYKGVHETTNVEHHERTNPTCPAFKEIGEAFGHLDLSLIGIGAYAPRHIFSSVHASPEDAVCMHQDLRSRKSIGMHWGTFILTTEPTDEPPRRLKAAVAAAGLPPDAFTVCEIGETITVKKQS